MADKLVITGVRTRFSALTAYRKFLRGEIGLEEYREALSAEVQERIRFVVDSDQGTKEHYQDGEHAGENT